MLFHFNVTADGQIDIQTHRQPQYQFLNHLAAQLKRFYTVYDPIVGCYLIKAYMYILTQATVFNNTSIH